jgi:hypothetical protein
MTARTTVICTSSPPQSLPAVLSTSTLRMNSTSLQDIVLYFSDSFSLSHPRRFTMELSDSVSRSASSNVKLTSILLAHKFGPSDIVPPRHASASNPYLIPGPGEIRNKIYSEMFSDLTSNRSSKSAKALPLKLEAYSAAGVKIIFTIFVKPYCSFVLFQSLGDFRSILCQ